MSPSRSAPWLLLAVLACGDPVGPDAPKPIDRNVVGTAPELPPGLEQVPPKPKPPPTATVAVVGPAMQGPIDASTRVRFSVEAGGATAVLIDGTRLQARVRCPGGAQSDVGAETADLLLTALEAAPPGKRTEEGPKVTVTWALQCACDAARCDCLPEALAPMLAAACSSADFKEAPRSGALKLRLQEADPRSSNSRAFTFEGDAKGGTGSLLRTSRRGSWVGRSGPMPPKALAAFFKVLDAQRWHVLPSVSVLTVRGQRAAASVPATVSLSRGGTEHTFTVSGGCPCADGGERCTCPSAQLLEAVRALAQEIPVTATHVVTLTPTRAVKQGVRGGQAQPAKCEVLDGAVLCKVEGIQVPCLPTEQLHRFECFDPLLDFTATVDDPKAKAAKVKLPATFAVSHESEAPCLLSGRGKFTCPGGKTLQKLRKSGEVWLANDEKNHEVRLEAVWQVPVT